MCALRKSLHYKVVVVVVVVVGDDDVTKKLFGLRSGPKKVVWQVEIKYICRLNFWVDKERERWRNQINLKECSMRE